MYVIYMAVFRSPPLPEDEDAEAEEESDADTSMEDAMIVSHNEKEKASTSLALIEEAALTPVWHYQSLSTEIVRLRVALWARLLTPLGPVNPLKVYFSGQSLVWEGTGASLMAVSCACDLWAVSSRYGYWTWHWLCPSYMVSECWFASTPLYPPRILCVQTSSDYTSLSLTMRVRILLALAIFRLDEESPVRYVDFYMDFCCHCRQCLRFLSLWAIVLLFSVSLARELTIVEIDLLSTVTPLVLLCCFSRCSC